MAFLLTKTTVAEKLSVPNLGVIKDNVRVWLYNATGLDGTLRDVSDAIDMRGLKDIVISIYNSGSTNPLTDFKILCYPHADVVAKAIDINSTTYFYAAISTSLAKETLGLAIAKIRVEGVGFVKIQAKAAGGALTDLDIYISATLI